MEALALILVGTAGLASLVCYIIVLVNMFLQGDIIQGLIGLICCQLWVFIWGWIYFRHPMRGKVMTIWTIAIIAAVIGQVLLGPEYYQRAGY